MRCAIELGRVDLGKNRFGSVIYFLIFHFSIYSLHTAKLAGEVVLIFNNSTTITPHVSLLAHDYLIFFKSDIYIYI